MKTAIKWIGGAALVLVLAALGYAAYVFLGSDRIEDRQPLDIQAGWPAADAVPVDTPQRVLSYNIGFGAYSDDYSFFMDGGTESRARSPQDVRRNIGGAMEAVQSARPDLALIQEVDEDGTRSHHIDERELVIRALPDYSSVYARNYDSPYLLYPFSSPHGANQAGEMTFSRYPITAALRRSLPIEKGFMQVLDLDRCYAVHRLPAADGKELVLYNFHLSAYTSDGSIAEEQMTMLFADMQAEYAAGNYAIAGGDFNKDVLGNSAQVFKTTGETFTWAQPIPRSLVPQGLRIVAPFDENAPVASCRNADRPYGPDNYLVTVDGFVVSDNVKTQRCRVIDTQFKWSDHNPVYLDFTLD